MMMVMNSVALERRVVLSRSVVMCMLAVVCDDCVDG